MRWIRLFYGDQLRVLTVEFRRADRSFTDPMSWYRTFREVVFEHGAIWTDIRESANRLEAGLKTLAGEGCAGGDGSCQECTGDRESFQCKADGSLQMLGPGDPIRWLVTMSAALIFSALAGASSTVSAQMPSPCGISASVGVAVPTDESSRIEPFMSEQQFTREELSSGTALSLEADCPLGGPWRAVIGGERLDLDDAVLWHFTVGLGARARPAERVSFSGWVRGGWRHAMDERPPTPDVGVDLSDRLLLGDSGPVLGGDLRFAVRPGESVELFARAGWRAGWFDRRIVDFEAGTRRPESEPVHVFPVTGGVTLRF